MAPTNVRGVFSGTHPTASQGSVTLRGAEKAMGGNGANADMWGRGKGGLGGKGQVTGYKCKLGASQCGRGEMSG